ncbi:MAG: hypothetical protein GY798_11330 [Hyphomicrobiales bacterium]|nr:hypothetical protein [Hyphomicrobiales bacterium]
MSKREEILDMAVHALTPLMRGRPQASAADLFDESLDIGEKLVAKVEETVKRNGAPERDELLDMGVHALSALLNSRQPARVEEVLNECMEVARALIAKVDADLVDGADEDAREELLDMAVHAQTALLNSRPKMPADDLADQCVTIAKDLIAKVDAQLA